MTTESSNNNFRNFSTFVSIAFFYFTFCGGLWNMSYWGNFDINIFQYMDLSDIIKSFIYPFIQISWLDLIMLAIMPPILYYSVKQGDILRKSHENSYYKSHGTTLKDSKEFKLRKRVILFLVIPILFFLSMFCFYQSDKNYGIAISIGYMLSFLISFKIYNLGYLNKFIKKPFIQIWIMSFFIALLPLSIIGGLKAARPIVKNTMYKAVTSLESKEFSDTTKFINSKYIGSMGGKIFLFSQNGLEVYILNEEKINYLGLTLIMSVKKYKSIHKL